MENFADRFIDAVKEKKNPSICGLDPDIGNLPPKIIEKYKLSHFSLDDLGAVGEAIFEFNCTEIDAIADIMPAVKLQMAFYEKYGIPGIQAFMQTVKYAKDKGLIVIEDAKRNDIGKTAQQYADGHIGEVELLDGRKVKVFDVDDITVTPYLGADGVKPFIEYCKAGKGVFLLDRTSNPSAVDLQDRLVLLNPEETQLINNRLLNTGLNFSDLPVMEKNKNRVIKTLTFVADGQETKYDLKYGDLPVAPNYAVMALLIDKWGSVPEAIGKKGYTSVGAVIGATYPDEAKILRKLMPITIFLGPGYGGQGATGEDAQNLFNDDGFGAGINNSGSLNFAYKKKPWSEEYGPDRYGDATRAAAIAMRDDIVGALRNHGKWHLD